MSLIGRSATVFHHYAPDPILSHPSQMRQACSPFHYRSVFAYCLFPSVEVTLLGRSENVPTRKFHWMTLAVHKRSRLVQMTRPSAVNYRGNTDSFEGPLDTANTRVLREHLTGVKIKCCLLLLCSKCSCHFPTHL